jgi:Ala-tRNA(Pro) deacylase
MAINSRLQQLLDQQGASYEVLPHREAFTAQEVARESHVSGRRVAKVVVIRDEAGADLMVVVPAPLHVDRGQIRLVTGRHGIHLEDEAELRRLFPDCELGAMPPFGALYGMPVYVDPCLAFEKNLFFQAGNHHEVVRMRYEDFLRLASPVVLDVCLHREAPVMAV